MPSLDHEGLLLLFRQRPSLAVDLLRNALGGDLPTGELRLEETNLSQIFPTEYRADLVIALGNEWRVIVEIQLRRDRRKLSSWPLYLAALQAKSNCRVMLFVIAPTPSVAAWARKPIYSGHPEHVLRPVVIGPEAVPAVEDVDVARRDPEMAVLSAFAHGKSERGARVAHAALRALVGLDSDRVGGYHDLVHHALSAAQHEVLEEIMANGGYEYQSEFARRYVREGRQEGLKEGLKEGRQEGVREGVKEGLAMALLEVLGGRNLMISDEARARILGNADAPTLQRWLSRALNIDTVEQLFD